MIPQLLDIYQRWLKPIQTHHAAFTTMEGMAEFAVQSILKDDSDFQNYLSTFMGTDFSSYQVRKSLGKDFTKEIFEKHIIFQCPQDKSTSAESIMGYCSTK